MTEVWALPGYDVQGLIGFGATGEVWRARELATGELVALKRLRDGADPEAVLSLRREAAVLGSLETPYVVRLRAVLGEGADLVLVLDLATGGSLAALLARRGCLDPGEVVTVAGPLAQALAAAHACGLVHGDVTPSNVLFTAEGMPLLADLGLARLAGAPSQGADGTAEYVDPVVAAGGQPDAASDVWALAAVCHHLLSGTPPHDGVSVGAVLDAARAGARAPLGLLAPSAPRPLVEAIEQALSADPAARPDAAAFAALLRRAHAAAPVRLVTGASDAYDPAIRPTHAVHRPAEPVPTAAASGRLPRRPLLLSAGALVLLAVAAAVGWLSGRAQPVELGVTAAAPLAAPSPTAMSTTRAETPTTAKQVPPTPDWQAVLDGLDVARSEAFASGSAVLLDQVYAPSSPLLAADRQAVDRLTATGRRATGVRHAVRSLRVERSDGTAATLRVVDELSAYTVVDTAGQVVERADGRAAAAFRVTLVRTVGGWRLQDVVRV